MSAIRATANRAPYHGRRAANITIEERWAFYDSRVDRDGDGGCWVWNGARDIYGYGLLHLKPGRATRAHRAFYERHREAIEPGLLLHHTCERKECVNPDHLVVLTREEHCRAHPDVLARAQAAGIAVAREAQRSRTHCFRGHSLADHGQTNKRGHTRCRACQRLRYRRARDNR